VSELTPFVVLVLPLGLGLLGFVEPCSIGSTLLVVKYLEGKDAATRLVQVGLFAGARALLTGALGVLAVLTGGAFAGVQRGGWILLGALYVALGLLHASGRGARLTGALAPRLARGLEARGPAALGALFGLNVPACAAPLLAALLAGAAAGAAAGLTLGAGFVALGLFGLALSLPLVAAVLLPSARRALDRLAALGGRLPVWTGALLVALGLWSAGIALLAPARVP
jgi:cytochrome c-type biogenesis protein